MSNCDETIDERDSTATRMEREKYMMDDVNDCGERDGRSTASQKLLEPECA